MEEATAYSRRMLIRPQGLVIRQRPVTELFVGCRPGGAWSYYFDETPVLQFNNSYSLRRVHWEGELWSAQSGRLVQLYREASGGRVEQLRRCPSQDELQPLIDQITKLVGDVLKSFTPQVPDGWIVRQIPETDHPIKLDCLLCLQSNFPKIQIANSPHALA